MPFSSAPPVNDTGDVTNVTLALRTLGSFDFEGHSLTQFVRHCAEHYLASEHKEIRAEAVITCARLLSPLLQVVLSFLRVRVKGEGTFLAWDSSICAPVSSLWLENIL